MKDDDDYEFYLSNVLYLPPEKLSSALKALRADHHQHLNLYQSLLRKERRSASATKDSKIKLQQKREEAIIELTEAKMVLEYRREEGICLPVVIKELEDKVRTCEIKCKMAELAISRPEDEAEMKKLQAEYDEIMKPKDPNK